MRCDTQVRSEVVSAARASVPAAFNIGTGRGNPDDNKTFVVLLLTKSNFVFRELEVEELDTSTLHVVKVCICIGTACDLTGRDSQRIGPYRKGIIAALIEQEFFHNHEQMAVADATRHLFNPMPIPVIAFVATAVRWDPCRGAG